MTSPISKGLLAILQKQAMYHVRLQLNRPQAKNKEKGNITTSLVALGRKGRGLGLAFQRQLDPFHVAKMRPVAVPRREHNQVVLQGEIGNDCAPR